MSCSKKHKYHPFSLILILSIALIPHRIAAQQTGDPTQTQAKQAVDLVLKHIVLDPTVQVPKTGKPLPTDGHWSVEKQPPPICSQAAPQNAQPCIGVVYKAPDTDVTCQWVVLLEEDGGSGTMIEQNDDATRYFLHKLSPEEFKRVPVLKTQEPVYPPIARAAHVSGQVKFQIIVGPDGKIASAILQSGPEMLRTSAASALKGFLFKPLVIGSRPVSFLTEATVHFEMI